MCSGSAACGNSTVPSGNIGNGLAISSTYRVTSAFGERSVRARPEAGGGGGRLLAAVTGQQSGQHVELARGFREVPEPTEQPREVAALAQRDPGDPQPQ